VTTEIVPETNEEIVADKIAERAARGWDLYLSRRQKITKTGEDTYTVPSCTGLRRGQRSYTVQYGADVESCTCADYGVHHGRIACKHLTAVALLYATRRRRPSTVRKLAGALGVEPQEFIEADRCSGKRVDG
jgi:uncharacterized Zn finger protein